MFTIKNPTWRELAAIINSMSLRDQLQTIQFGIDAQSYIGHTLRPRLVGSTEGLSIKLELTSGMIIPTSHDVAEFTCEVADIALTQSSQSEIQGRWDWYDKPRGQGSETSFATKEEAVMDAIRTRYSMNDWMQAVSDGNTLVGYVEWALSEALAEASDELSGMQASVELMQEAHHATAR